MVEEMDEYRELERQRRNLEHFIADLTAISEAV